MQDRLAAVTGEGRGDREEPVAQTLGFPPAGFMLGVGEEPGPRGDLGRESCDRGPDPVLIEPVEGEVAQTGVFRITDAVFAACPAAVAQLEVLQLPAARVGGERGEPVTLDVIETELRARVRALSPHDHPHPVGPSGQIQQPRQLRDRGPVADIPAGIERGLPCAFVGDEFVEL